MDIKNEAYSLIKTLTAIASSFGVVWMFVEPLVEDYVHDHIDVKQEQTLSQLKELKQIVDEDHAHSIEKRNEIIREIQLIHRRTQLRTE